MVFVVCVRCEVFADVCRGLLANNMIILFNNYNYNLYVCSSSGVDGYNVV